MSYPAEQSQKPPKTPRFGGFCVCSRNYWGRP